MTPKPRILVIEDDEMIRENIAEILEYEEYEVFKAANGFDGVRDCSEIRPDLILCDINMPKLDGYGVLEKLRKDPELKALPFVFLTAHGERDDVRRGMGLGADDYLSKPFKTADLLAAVETRLEQSRKREEVNRRERDQFSEEISTMIPHELKTPLNSLCTLTELLRDDWENMEVGEIREYLDLMSESGDRLKKVVENLSLYSYLSSRRKPEREDGPESEGSDAELISGYLFQIGEGVAATYDRAADLEMELPEEGPSVGKCNLIGKAFSELLDNAFKFSSSGSSVRVTLREENSRVEIAIVDKGEGMTPDQIRKVDALIQFDRGRKEQQGVGIGLALSREICDHLGGALELAPTPEGGMTVRILLRQAVEDQS